MGLYILVGCEHRDAENSKFDIDMIGLGVVVTDFPVFEVDAFGEGVVDYGGESSGDPSRGFIVMER